MLSRQTYLHRNGIRNCEISLIKILNVVHWKYCIFFFSKLRLSENKTTAFFVLFNRVIDNRAFTAPHNLIKKIKRTFRTSRTRHTNKCEGQIVLINPQNALQSTYSSVIKKLSCYSGHV